MCSQVFYFSVGKCILSNTVSLRINVYKVFAVFLQPETREMEKRPQLDNSLLMPSFQPNSPFELSL